MLRALLVFAASAMSFASSPSRAIVIPIMDRASQGLNYWPDVRDEAAIENPNEFIIDRARPRTHLSFGFGIHRCVGMRLAELQLRIVWQEMLKRFEKIEVVGEPKRVYSSFVRGIESLPVRIPG